MTSPEVSSASSPPTGSSRGAAGSCQGVSWPRTTTALRADTIVRVHFWANSTKVRIGWMRKSP